MFRVVVAQKKKFGVLEVVHVCVEKSWVLCRFCPSSGAHVWKSFVLRLCGLGHECNTTGLTSCAPCTIDTERLQQTNDADGVFKHPCTQAFSSTCPT